MLLLSSPCSSVSSVVLLPVPAFRLYIPRLSYKLSSRFLTYERRQPVDKLLGALADTGQRFLMQTYSALDRYYHKKNGRAYFFLTPAPLALLASLFDDIEYRGTNESDAVAKLPDGTRAYFQCVDTLERPPERAFTVQHLYYDFTENYFIDPVGLYADLRSRSIVPLRPIETTPALLRDAALLVARYDLSAPDDLFGPCPERQMLGLYEQNLLLTALLTAEFPHKGLALLRASGFISRHWPEIELMATIPQTKDHHPEGNVLDHVLAAFASRKRNDLALSLAILLHDLGKTVSEGTRENPYHDHAGRGALLARDFLRRLGFEAPLIEDVVFLVRHHMMPEALPRMPLFRIEKLLDSPLFPSLLELYRADLLSTFHSPDKYYEACRIYSAYRKKSGNPYKHLNAGKPVA
jgi:poly(A) polymerase